MSFDGLCSHCGPTSASPKQVEISLDMTAMAEVPEKSTEISAQKVEGTVENSDVTSRPKAELKGMLKTKSSGEHLLRPPMGFPTVAISKDDCRPTPARKMTRSHNIPRPSWAGFLNKGRVDFDRRGSWPEVLRSDEYCREYDHMVTVELKTTFLKIHDIDTLSQQFEAEVYVQSKWEEPALAGMEPRELDHMLPGDLWDPHLTILNIAGDFDHERRSYVVRYEEGYEAPVVLHRWRFKGLFRKALELRHFPFDVQDLTIQLSTERSLEEIQMTHDKFQLSSVNTRTFQDSQEWSIYNHVQCDYRNTTVEYASSTIHPILVFSCRVRRRVGYFMWNIVCIVFLVLILSLLTVSVEPVSSDRLASTMTLFLTMVAFKLVVKQSLPTISYLTYLDLYVLGSMMYLVLYAMENSVMNSLGRWMDNDLVEAYDNFFCMFLAAILTLFHLVFIIHIQVTALKRHRLMSDNDARYAIQARNLALRERSKSQSRSKPRQSSA